MRSSLSKSVNMALDWLINSDIRDKDQASIAFGGTKQGYNWKEQSYPFVYSEITGYAISAYVSAYRWTEAQKYLDLANEAATFLLTAQANAEKDGESGAIPHGFSLPELQLTRRYFSFDAAMCLQGLLDLDAIQPSEKLKESAEAIGKWLTSKMQHTNGSFLAMYDAYTGERYHNDNNFFDDFGCLHSKHAIGLIKLSKVTNHSEYLEAAQAVCDWVIGLQNEDGAIRANNWMRRTVSHPHCYAIEGLLYAGATLKNQRFSDAAYRGGEWLLKVQNRDGSLNIEYNRPWWRMGRRVIADKFFPKRVTDATAQAVRIWIMLYYLSGDQKFIEAAYKATNFLSGMQCSDTTDHNAFGGFYFWKGHPIMFSWVTMFAMNAIYALDNIKRSDGFRQMLVELY